MGRVSRKGKVGTSIDPRLSLGAGEESVGFGVVDEFFLDGIVFQVAFEPHADIGGVHGAHRVVHDVRAGDGVLRAT